jgi:hypothetical protein
MRCGYVKNVIAEKYQSPKLKFFFEFIDRGCVQTTISFGLLTSGSNY